MPWGRDLGDYEAEGEEATARHHTERLERHDYTMFPSWGPGDYAIYNGRELFKPLAERMEALPDLVVTFCLDINRTYGNASSDEAIVAQFAEDFRSKHWPWKRLPKVLYDPRGLVVGGPQRGSLHAKCVVVDRLTALVTSANFTEAAQHRNIEAGILIRHPGMIERLVGYFEGLEATGKLTRCALSS